MKTTAAARLDRATVAALVAAVLMPVALGLIFFYVPNDADQGFSQRIFYFHVPIALTTYALFGWGALNAARYLWTGDLGARPAQLRAHAPRRDLRHAHARHRVDLGARSRGAPGGTGAAPS